MFQSVERLLLLCQRKCPPALELLLPDGDGVVCRELRRCVRKQHGNCNRNWVDTHAEQYSAIGARWGEPSPDPRTESSRWFQTLTPFQRSVLLYAQHKDICSTRVAGSADAASGPVSKFMVDVWPNLGRERVSIHHQGVGQISPCIVPQQIMWLHFQDREPRPMLGKESMLFQGWPIEPLDLPDWVDNKFLQDLAGNGVALPVMLALVMSTLSALTFTKDNGVPNLDAVEDPDVQEAFQLLASMTSHRLDSMGVTKSTTDDPVAPKKHTAYTDTPSTRVKKRPRCMSSL